MRTFLRWIAYLIVAAIFAVVFILAQGAGPVHH